MMASASARLLDRGSRAGIFLVVALLIFAGAVTSPEWLSSTGPTGRQFAVDQSLIVPS